MQVAVVMRVVLAAARLPRLPLEHEALHHRNAVRDPDLDAVRFAPAALAPGSDHAIRLRCLVVPFDPREETPAPHRPVDDRPYGGGPGRVMTPEPLSAAIGRARDRAPEGPVILLSPQGRPLTQAGARRLAAGGAATLVCGRYEGVDERVVCQEVDEELSIGDYVLSGGEFAALVVIDATARLIPGVLGDATSAACDSFADGLLDYPHYTRPETFAGMDVPPVLLSGDHAAIRRWRLMQSLGRTWQRRPELIEGRALTDEESALLKEFRSSEQKES